jgi:hypothetical protein
MLVELGVPVDRVPPREAFYSSLGEYSPLGLARRLAEGGGGVYAENLRVLEEAIRSREKESR